MTTLETLFSPMQKEKLRQAALVRTSCRSFAGAPDTAAFAALSYVVGRCALPGARLVLTPVDESLFTGTILGMGRITGCKMAAVVIACGTEALCRVNAGILGEAFVLEATALGLGTCWVSGTYRRKQIRLPMQENETVLAVIAVGVPEKPLQAPKNRRRKPLDKLMNAVPADGMMLDAAKLVQIAPSAMNMQPWRMEALPGAFALTISDRALLDGGIADSIPVRFFESIGYKRNLIVLTQPKGFVKKKNKMLPAIRARYLRYPAFVEAVADRHERYNETLDHIAMLEQTGKAFVIRPPIPLEIGAMERDPAQLRRVYETGRAVAENQIDKIEAFLNDVKETQE